MNKAKFNAKSLLLTVMSFIFFALFPALLSSLGVYGLLITQIEEPALREHLIVAVAGFLPSAILYFFLLRMESGRRKKRLKRKEHKLFLKQYANKTPFNNGDSVLSTFNGEQHYEKLTPDEIVMMKHELARKVSEKLEDGSLKKQGWCKNNGGILDL